jgi:hypothetical protein
MNDNKGFSDSISTVSASADGTPLERQILSPLTPPATDEWPIPPPEPSSLIYDQNGFDFTMATTMRM